MGQEKISFSFGRNWKKFLEKFDGERLDEAVKSLKDFMGLPNFEGKTFLDIGCGSGLFSLAARKMGATKVVSIDIDPFSVECAKFLKGKEGDPSNWEVLHGSVLDQGFISSLGQFDIVYSWGVLHHTGKMWEAIENAAKLVGPQGHFYIAIYNKTRGLDGTANWIRIKKLYNAWPDIGKRAIEGVYASLYFLAHILSFRNPIKKIKAYKSRRGMNWYRDIVDWLGGYPFEAATTEEIFRFVRQKFPDFELINLKSTNATGNNWFCFKRK